MHVQGPLVTLRKATWSVLCGDYGPPQTMLLSLVKGSRTHHCGTKIIWNGGIRVPEIFYLFKNRAP